MHHLYMQRCFDLARLGAGRVSPNPMVGAVLVYDGRIIGEGWHRQYGQAHAEVNAVASVRQEERHLIPDSTLYVSLEPCNIHGKTPPCTSLLLREGIRKVVISCLDQTPGVQGKGVALLQQAGVEVTVGVMKDKGLEISAFRNVYVEKKRPYILLKYAQTPNGYMGIPDRQVWITNPFSKRWVHKLRAEYDAILIGTQTALTDNPRLTNRLWPGRPPLRIVLDRSLRIPPSHYLYLPDAPTLIVTAQQPPPNPPAHVSYWQDPFDEELLQRLMAELYRLNVTSLIVEGGSATLQHFIDKKYRDEAWVFTGNRLLPPGVPAPQLFGKVEQVWNIDGDRLEIIRKL